MTIAPASEVGVRVSADMSPIAKGLATAFTAPPQQLLKLGAALSAGQIPLTQRAVRFAPFIGHSAARMEVIRKMATEGNILARRELAAISAHHMTTRFTPLVGFLAQFPPSWRQLLLGTVRDDLTAIELRVGPGNRVSDVLTWHAGTLHEYGLRAFTLTFAQLRQVAAWIRDNEDLLPTITLHVPPGRKDDKAAEDARAAALITFFDNMPEKMRDLLVAKARPELVGMRFETLPTGDVVLRIRATTSR